MSSRPVLVLAWLTAAAVWGSSFLFIEVGLAGLAPGQVALARLLLGSLTLGSWVLLARVPLPRGLLVWGHLAVLGLLFCAVPFALFAWAQTRVSSGLASILNATTPLWTLLLVVLFLRVERVSAARAAGVAVGFVGVAVVSWPDAVALASGAGGDLAGQLACLAATACYGAGFVWLRRFVLPLGLHPVAIAFGQVACALGWSLLAAPVLSTGPVTLSTPVVGAMVALGALGTGLAYVLNTAVTRGLGATFASTVTYLTPVVGVVLGAVVLREDIGGHELAGGAVVVLGVAIGQGVLPRVLAGLRPTAPPRGRGPASRPARRRGPGRLARRAGPGAP